MFAFLAAHRREQFPDAMFADLFPTGRGRPSVPADVMAAVITLQALHGFSDAETVDEVTFDWWKAACGLPVTAGAFHATTLTYWRRRLAASDRPNRVFYAVKAVVAQTGALAGARHGGRAFEGVWDDDDYEPKRFFCHYLDEDWLLWLSNSSPWSRFGEFRTAGTGCTSSADSQKTIYGGECPNRGAASSGEEAIIDYSSVDIPALTAWPSARADA